MTRRNSLQRKRDSTFLVNAAWNKVFAVLVVPKSEILRGLECVHRVHDRVVYNMRNVRARIAI
jgi:hypothetical protein